MSLLLILWDVSVYLVSVGVVVLALVAWRAHRAQRYPPGLASLPVIGSVPFMDVQEGKGLHLYFYEMSQKYGPLFSFSLGNKPVVVLTGYKIIHEAFVQKAIPFAGRPVRELKDEILGNVNHVGIAKGTYSLEWKAQRNVSMTLLRSLGYGQSSTEAKIKEECKYLLRVFEQHEGAAFSPDTILHISVANIICHLLFGVRYRHDDEEFVEFLEDLKLFLEHNWKHAELEYIPLLRLLPSSRRDIAEHREVSNRVMTFIHNKINDRRDNMTEQPTDFVQAYLQELDKASQGSSKITENWISMIVTEFFIAGSDTTSQTLTWALLYMVKFPDIQRKVRAEIDNVLRSVDGSYREVELSDRSAMPYTEATIMEIQRYCTLVPITLPHTTTCDVELQGYVIPKGTEIYGNLWQTMRDPDIWADPDAFDPTRFLDDNGQVERNEKWLPFSLGRRVCMGEQLARQELFLFFVFILQSFALAESDANPLPVLEPAEAWVTCKPHHYLLTATKRQ